MTSPFQLGDQSIFQQVIELRCDAEAAQFSRERETWCNVALAAYRFARSHPAAGDIEMLRTPPILARSIKLGLEAGRRLSSPEEFSIEREQWLASLPTAQQLLDWLIELGEDRVWFQRYRLKSEPEGGWSVGNSYWMSNVDHLWDLEDFERFIGMVREGVRVGPLPTGYDPLIVKDLPEEHRRSLYGFITESLYLYETCSPWWSWFHCLCQDAMLPGQAQANQRPNKISG